MMDSPLFWRFIESAKQAHQNDPEQQVHALTDALVQRSEAESIAFDARFRHSLSITYTHDLWASASMLNGGCSDDCFDYFRAWLIAQGETVVQNALRDPETLADVAEIETIEGESMLSVAHVAYERKTGKPLLCQGHTILQLTGDAWDEATVDQKYPKLAAKWD